MPATLTEFGQQARMLPKQDRARLAQVLLESLRDAPLRKINAAYRDTWTAYCGATD